jgi:hypothetical protein
MPIIDFPFYLDSLSLEAAIRSTGRVLAYEEVNGLNASDGEIRALISGVGTVYSNANIDGVTYTGALIAGIGALTNTADPIVSATVSASISTTSYLEGTLSYGEGRAYLPALVSFGSDRELISGLTYLPTLYSLADGGWYVPPELVGGYALLTGLASAGLIKQPEIGEGYLPTPVSQGWVFTTGLDEEFNQPFYAEAKIFASGTVLPDAQIDGRYLSALNAVLSGTGTVYNNITIDGITYTGAIAPAAGTVVGTATITHPLEAAISGVGTFNPSNDLGQVDPWTAVGIGFGYLSGLRSYAYTGERLEAQFDSFLFQFSAKVGYGIYTHTFDNTLLFTDQFISLLASAIYTETLSNFALNISDEFAPYITGVKTFDSTLTATSLVAAHRFFIDTFTSALSSTTAFSALRDQLATFAGTLTLADVFSALKQIIGEFLSSLTFDDAVSALATYDLLLLETLRTKDTYTPNVGTTAAPLEGACATWVIDVETKASVQYDRFNFNSYAKHGDTYIAAAEDGIYELAGDTDAGQDISALVDLAVSRFATPQRKYFPSVYLGVTSTGKLLLKAEVDGQTWLYEANNAAINTANQRIDLGRGIVGSHWRFTLLNQNGLDFELESVEFLPLISSRRVY